MPHKSEKNTSALFTKEIKLILYCSQVKIKDRSRIDSLIDDDLDWDYIYNFCYLHRIIPLIYINVKEINKLQISKDILKKFSNFYNDNTFRNILFSSYLVTLTNCFIEKEINVISFKGSTLAVSAYDNIALRTFCDLDILIDKKNVSGAINIIDQLGYSLCKQTKKTKELSHNKSSVFNESQHNQKSLVFFKEKLVLELHWSLSEKSFPIKVTFKQLWNNRTHISLSGTNIFQFSTEDLLLYLCVHGSSHYWFKLKWICDVNELIRANPRLDWQIIQKRANEWRCKRMLHLGLILVHNLLDSDLPKSIQQEIKTDVTAQFLAKQVIQLLFYTSENQFNYYLFLLKCREDYRDKITYLFTTIFTPNEKDWGFFKLPQIFRFLYYVIRPYRLLIKFCFNTNK